MKITDLYIRRLSSRYTGTAEAYQDTSIVNATDIYPDFKRHSAASRVTITPTTDENGAQTIVQDFLQIDTDAGISGIVGPITLPGINYYLLNHVKYTLLGQDPMSINYLWDIMYRIGLDQKEGDLTRAVSHAEAALWDIKCKSLNVPLYELLGGKARREAPVYFNTAGLSHEKDVLLPVIKKHVAAGAAGVKIYSKYGPQQGKAGIEKTRQTLEAVRETIGPDALLSLEAVCCWDYEYTKQLAESIRHIDIAWLEEPCLPDRMDEYARLRKDCPIPISAGEHSAFRWSFKQMMDMEAADIYQPEPMWGGGIGEVMRIITLASAYNRKVYLHNCNPSVVAHIMCATGPDVCPMTEYLININEAAQYFYKYPQPPKAGMIAPAEVPGIGNDIEESKVEKEVKLT